MLYNLFTQKLAGIAIWQPVLALACRECWLYRSDSWNFKGSCWSFLSVVCWRYSSILELSSFILEIAGYLSHWKYWVIF